MRENVMLLIQNDRNKIDEKVEIKPKQRWKVKETKDRGSERERERAVQFFI